MAYLFLNFTKLCANYNNYFVFISNIAWAHQTKWVCIHRALNSHNNCECAGQVWHDFKKHVLCHLFLIVTIGIAIIAPD